VIAAGLRLRNIEPADRAALADLWVAAWRGTGLAIDFSARRDWFMARLGELASSGAEILVAVRTGAAPAGFVTIHPQTGHLDQLCVAPAWQGDGTARALLDAAKSRAGGRVRLEVNADNLRARRFYRREGFVETGTGVSAASGLPILLMEWRPDKPEGRTGAKERGVNE
jgi:putative acetyltransferase